MDIKSAVTPCFKRKNVIRGWRGAWKKSSQPRVSPPYKQLPADLGKLENQRLYRQGMRVEASRHFSEPTMGEVRVEIVYTRAEGRSDAASIIGGIIDSLRGIAYANDRQVVEVHYREKRGRADEYSVRVSL